MLEKAVEIFNTIKTQNIVSVEDYIEEALEGKFDKLDNEYYDCSPTINEILEKYLKEYRSEFITII